MVTVHAVYVVVQTIGLCIMARQMEKDAIAAEELGRLSSHIGRKEGVFDLGFDDRAMQSHLGDHFKSTMLAVRRTLQRVASSIDKVSATSKNIADGTGELLSRSEEQGRLLHQAIQTLESMSKMAQSASAQAGEANDIAESAGHVAAQGKELVDELAEAMNGVQESSSRISDISTLIDGIAFQTNILALNASVEAARGGESGRGFAVVAAEVRTLAQRTAEASRDIRQLIQTSQKQVDESASKTDAVASTIHDILDQTNKVASIMNALSAGAREQSEGITQVSDAINNVGDAVGDNVMVVASAAAAAADLRQQAEALIEAVQVFELGEEEPELPELAEHQVA